MASPGNGCSVAVQRWPIADTYGWRDPLDDAVASASGVVYKTLIPQRNFAHHSRACEYSTNRHRGRVDRDTGTFRGLTDD